MNMLNLIDGVAISFRETGPDHWVVTVGSDERTITKDERGFIAHVGHFDRHWCFDNALKACIVDVQYQASRTVTQPVPLPAEERELLEYSDAHNAPDRMAASDRAALKLEIG